MNPVLQIITLVLDGQPYIRHHLPQFEKLKCDWHWTIVEGVALPENCTRWCKAIEPRLSLDGTSEYLSSIRNHPRVTVIKRTAWHGKIEMLRVGVATMTQPGVIMQIDSDELWTTAQLEKIMQCFRMRQIGKMYFFCRFFVGPDIVTLGEDCYGNNRTFEWLRAWRYAPGMVFQSHERPVFNRNEGLAMGRHETRALDLVFDHKAYASEAQVRFKETYYGYTGAVEQWRRLQANTEWPVKRLKDYLPWVDDRVGACKIALA